VTEAAQVGECDRQSGRDPCQRIRGVDEDLGAAAGEQVDQHRTVRLAVLARLETGEKATHERVCVEGEQLGEIGRDGEFRQGADRLGRRSTRPDCGERRQVVDQPRRAWPAGERDPGATHGVGTVAQQRLHEHVRREPVPAGDHGEHPLVLEHRPFADDLAPCRARGCWGDRARVRRWAHHRSSGWQRQERRASRGGDRADGRQHP
jgi:hypothetical protein